MQFKPMVSKGQLYSFSELIIQKKIIMGNNLHLVPQVCNKCIWQRQSLDYISNVTWTQILMFLKTQQIFFQPTSILKEPTRLFHPFKKHAEGWMPAECSWQLCTSTLSWGIICLPKVSHTCPQRSLCQLYILYYGLLNMTSTDETGVGEREVVRKN